MIDLFQDRRIFINQKRKQFHKNGLPDLKYHFGLIKRNNDDFIMKTQNYSNQSNQNNLMIYNNFQPLSNILISKRICPANNPQSPGIKKKIFSNKQIHKQLVQKVKMQSVKCIIHLQQQKKQQVIFQNDIFPLLQETGMTKRNSTSLSYRIRIKQRQKQKLIIDNQLTLLNEQPGGNKSKLKPEQNCFTFIIPKANNNEDLVRQILLSRKTWKQVKPGQQVPNLKWLFSKQRYNYKKMFSYTQKRIINHFEFHQEISTKDSLIRNLQIYCQTKKIEVFTVTPVTFIIDFDDEYCEHNIKQFLSFFSKNDSRKSNGAIKRSSNNNFNFVNKFQPYMAWQNSDIKKKINILSLPINNSCYYSQNSYIWLLKPTGLNRGRGIQIFDSLETLQKLLISFLDLLQRKKYNQSHNKQPEPNNKKKQKKERQSTLKQQKQRPSSIIQPIKNLQDSICLFPQKQKDSLGQTQGANNFGLEDSSNSACREKFKLNNCSFVIQKYIQKPFLIEGRKFDIRVWALLTHKMELFFFKQAYIRTSAEVYSTDDIGNYFIHLTNNAIQKNAVNYGQFQNGNQLSFKSLSKYMSQQKVDDTWSKIKEITYMAFSSVKKKINFYQRSNCFELFGLDYFISYDQKVWLIEVNQNPCIECSSELLSKLIPRMLNDAFKLTIDQILQKKPQEEKVFHVDGYQDSQSMWQSMGQLIANGKYNGTSPKKKNKESLQSNLNLISP